MHAIVNWDAEFAEAFRIDNGEQQQELKQDQ